PEIPAVQQTSVNQLEAKLNAEYGKIEKTIAGPPSRAQYPIAADYHQHLREWQDDLAQAFAAAANTIKEILKLNPPNADYWRERMETMELYAQPVSSPELRTIFSSGEVQKSARLINAPAAEYTDEARTAKTRGDVRLRIVLAADGTVKYVFAIKSLPHGLTESAMKATSAIEFEPAIRNAKRASQFITLVYEFKDGQARPPYIPKTIF
ncbi:MAG TPA: TonB family protein, partial [Pyrinomonadaceae bacterium]